MKNVTSQAFSPFGSKVQPFSRLENGPFRYSTRILSFGTVQRDAGGERFAYQLERHRHVRDHDLGAVGLRHALAHLQRLAQRHEFRIALDIGDEVEHLVGAVRDAALCGICGMLGLSADRARARP